MNRAIVLFDFDGTLADTFEAGARLINEFAVKFGYRQFDFANNKDLSARQIVKRSGVKFWQIPRLVRFFRKESAKRVDSIKPFVGINHLIKGISSKCDLGILSTNSEETVKKFLVNNQLDNFFSFIKTDVALFGKNRALRRVKRRLLKRYTHLIYIGDEIRDIEACRKAGVDIISVSWGYNSHEALMMHNHNVADDTEQLTKMILKAIPQQNA